MSRLKRDRGTVTIWVLGLCVGLMFLGGFGLDLWRAFTERRVLAGMADGAVVAGATAIDGVVWRATGDLELDVDAADARARAYLNAHASWNPSITETISVVPGGIEVILETEVEFTLLRILIDTEDQFDVSVNAFATPIASP